MASKRHLLQSSVVVGFFTLFGNLTGILVETSIAARLGLSRSSDAFYVAFTVPYIITNLITATGQFSLVPFFTTLEARHSANGLWRGFSYVVNVILLGLGSLAVVGAAGAPWLMRGIAPGLSRPQLDLATQLCQWLFLIIIPAGIAEVFRSFLLSQRRYSLSSASGFVRNVVVIALILLTFDRYGDYSIVLGYLAGHFLQLAVLGTQILISFPVRYSLTMAGTGEAFRNLRGSGAAQLIVAAAWQLVVIVERIIASFLPPGTLTALNYGFKILSSLAELLAGSVGTAALAPLAQAVALRARDSARKTFQTALEISLALVSPVMIFCLLLNRPIMRLIFERGNFTPEATVLMSRIFLYYSLSLTLAAGFRLLGFYLFARQEAWWYMRLAFLHHGLVLAFDLLYVGVLRLGPRGIPLGFFTSLAVTAGLAFQRNIAGLRADLGRSMGLFVAKSLLGAALAGLVVWGLRSWVGLPRTGLDNLIYLIELCGAGSLVFFAALALSKAFPLSQLTTVWQGASDRPAEDNLGLSDEGSNSARPLTK